MSEPLSKKDNYFFVLSKLINLQENKMFNFISFYIIFVVISIFFFLNSSNNNNTIVKILKDYLENLNRLKGR